MVKVKEEREKAGLVKKAKIWQPVTSLHGKWVRKKWKQ